MDYPLLIGGTRAGILTEYKSGLYTVFEASLPSDPGSLVRLYVHGEGESASLGLMQPQDGGLTLRRRMSALERRTFPAAIDYVSDTPDSARGVETNSLHNTNNEANVPVAKQNQDSVHNTEPPQQTTLSACPWPAPVPAGDGNLLWLKCTDGTLRAHDGVSSLVAFPARLRAPAPGTVLRRIGDADYLVFRR